MRVTIPIALLVSTMALTAASPFQQQVRYEITATLKPTEKKLWARTVVWYKNNSPDTLRMLYFHLYWNLFAPNSYARQKSGMRQMTISPVHILDMYENHNPKRKVLYRVDNTVMDAPLSRPLAPGDTTVLTIVTEASIPFEGMRMGYFGQAFSLAHWFPSVCVYDRYGWHTNQYLGTGEFYEEFADFEVTIRVPKAFSVFATGELKNADVVLPAPWRRRLDSAQRYQQPVYVADLQEGESLRATLPDTVQWHWQARNVRSFAFTAYQDYHWSAQGWNGTMVHVVYPPSLEDFYATEGLNAAVFAVQFMTRYVGPYPYPNLFVTVGGASGGMEYPGIVFMTRWLGGGIMRKITAEIIMHEVIHNWFPMVLNTDEQYYAFQDEGFTTFFTTLAIEAFYGRYDNFYARDGFWQQLLLPPMDQRTSLQLSAIRWAYQQQEEPILTHSERYASGTAYRVNSYNKTAAVLLMLQYVMGDSAFFDLFRQYYRRYRFRHIEPQDFFELAMEVDYRWNGRRDLRWFFDQWFAKTYTLDYALTDFQWERKKRRWYLVTVEVTNRGRAIMPVDVVVQLADGTTDTIWISEQEFLKGVRSVRKTKRVWQEPVRAEINPDGCLLDINRLNNTSDWLPPIQWRWTPIAQESPATLTHYQLFTFPIVWFNDVDGIQLGVAGRGSYLGTLYQTGFEILQGMRFRSHSTGGLLRFVHQPGRNRPAFGGKIFHLEGRRGGALFVDIPLQPTVSISAAIEYFDLFDPRYVFAYQWNPQGEAVLPARWWWVQNTFRWNFSLLDQPGTLRIGFDGGSQLLGDTGQPYVRWDVTWKQQWPVPSESWTLQTRVFAGFAPTSLPAAKAFRLASAPPFQAYQWRFYRSVGIFSADFLQQRHSAYGDAMLRGYADQDRLGAVILAANVQINIEPLLRWLPTYSSWIGRWIDLSLFYDVGMLWKTPYAVTLNRRWYQDAGFSISLRPLFYSTVGLHRYSSRLFDALDISDLRFDFPLFVSHPRPGQRQWQFRWKVSFRMAW